MVCDLGKAMHKKQGCECARLINVEFRLRARIMRLLADELGVPARELVGEIARTGRPDPVGPGRPAREICRADRKPL